MDQPAASLEVPPLTRGIGDTIAQREYFATPSRAGLQAPNRRHNLRTYFEPSGIRLHDRVASGSPELLRLSLTRMGRAPRLSSTGLAPVGAGRVSSDGSRVEISRPGLTEWYSNSDRGLEQGFRIASRPAGEGPLALELAVELASASLLGERILLATESGRRLSYDKLIVVDAAGERVASRMEVPDPGRIRIVVDDHEAEYPITIDPIVTGIPDAELQSNQPSAELGTSVSSAGDVNGDGFDDVIVGAPRFDAGEVDEGAAFIFLGGPGGIPNRDPLSAATRLESEEVNSTFGESVSEAGDVNGDGYGDVLVGAPLFPAPPHYTAGRVFVYLGSASGIPDGDELDASATLGRAGTSNDSFGHDVAAAGDVNGDGFDDVIVGAPWDRGFSGAAYVFLGSATGIASAEPEDAAAQYFSLFVEASLGHAVSGAGDVNGDGYDDVAITSWTQSDGGEDGPLLGVMVYHGSPTGPEGGFQTDADTILQVWANDLDRAGDVNGDGFDDLIASARYYGVGSPNGAAFLFHGGPAGIASGAATTAATRINIDQGQSGSVLSVAGAGDVNGDGFDDVIVGAPLFDAGETDEGAAFVYLGRASGIPNGSSATAFKQLESNQPLAGFGARVAGAGDVDRSGTGDVIVGAEKYDDGELDEGAALIYLPEPSGFVVGLVSGIVAFSLAAWRRRSLD